MKASLKSDYWRKLSVIGEKYIYCKVINTLFTLTHWCCMQASYERRNISVNWIANHVYSQLRKQYFFFALRSSCDIKDKRVASIDLVSEIIYLDRKNTNVCYWQGRRRKISLAIFNGTFLISIFSPLAFRMCVIFF